MDLGELDLTSSYNTEANKNLIISKYSHLFPLNSFINVKLDPESQAYSIGLKHDERMSQIPKLLQPIFVALVIASLTSAGTFIVASHEGIIKPEGNIS